MVHQSLGLRTRSVRSSAVLALAGLLWLSGCAETKQAPPAALSPALAAPRLAAGAVPSMPSEFRAAWVATVANIDWPSRKDLTVEQQKAEIIAIVNQAANLNLNALILQVRTSADSLYDSKLEPWSEYLTGAQGKAPEPYYDPLAMWIEEAHKRGIELHAWFNPYRARHTSATSPPAPGHVANKIPHAVKSYGGFLWMDPGEEAASTQTLNVILDVVRRYDIDGVHIDDYFYPYPVPVPGSAPPPPSADDTPAPREELPFPDDPAWQRYLASGGKLGRADWRRDNVNRLIEKIYTGIKAEKRWVKFGISPFGLGKPANRPPGIKGFSQYDKLFADAELWFNKGWLDYFTPQLYWAIGQEAQAYPVLLDNWIKENTQNRHLWPGMYLTRIQRADSTAKSWEPAEIVNQIALTRERGATNSLVRGHVHFSMVGMMQNRRGINEALVQASYKEAALVPASPWLASPPRQAEVRVNRRNGLLEVSFSVPRNFPEDAYSKAVLAERVAGVWRQYPSIEASTDRAPHTLLLSYRPTHSVPEVLVFTPYDRAGNPGRAVTITREMMEDVRAARP